MNSYLESVVKFSLSLRNNRARFNNDPTFKYCCASIGLIGGTAYSFINSYSPFWGSAMVLGGATIGYVTGAVYTGYSSYCAAAKDVRENPGNYDPRFVERIKNPLHRFNFAQIEVQQIAKEIIQNNYLNDPIIYITMQHYLSSEIINEVKNLASNASIGYNIIREVR